MEGKFVKERVIAAVQPFGESMTLQEAASISSAKNVKFRINSIIFSLQEKLKFLLKSCSFLSLYLDKSR